MCQNIPLSTTPFTRPWAMQRSFGGIQRSWSTLLPTIRPFAGKKTHRVLAFPEYLNTSFSKLMRKHQRNGSPMMPCAAEYVVSPTNMVPIGKTVGLKGTSLKHLTAIRKGFPVLSLASQSKNRTFGSPCWSFGFDRYERPKPHVASEWPRTLDASSNISVGCISAGAIEQCEQGRSHRDS